MPVKADASKNPRLIGRILTLPPERRFATGLRREPSRNAPDRSPALQTPSDFGGSARMRLKLQEAPSNDFVPELSHYVCEVEARIHFNRITRGHRDYRGPCRLTPACLERRQAEGHGGKLHQQPNSTGTRFPDVCAR